MFLFVILFLLVRAVYLDVADADVAVCAAVCHIHPHVSSFYWGDGGVCNRRDIAYMGAYRCPCLSIEADLDSEVAAVQFGV